MKSKVFILFLLVPTFFLAQCGSQKSSFSLSRSRSVDSLDSCFTLLKKKKHEEAVRCFESYRSSHRGSSAVAIADLAIADSYFANKEYLSAAEMYKIFVESHPFHEKVPYAYLQSGKSYLKAAPKTVDRDQSLLDQALTSLETLVFYYKGSSVYEEATALYKKVKYRKAKKEFYVGRFYYKQREYLAAIPRFSEVVNKYTDSGLEDQSFYYLIKALKRTSQQQIAAGYFEAYKKYFPERKAQIRKMAEMFD